MNAVKWNRVLYIILVIAAVTSLICWYTGDQIFTGGFVKNCIGSSVTVITVLSWFFCNVAWKWEFFKGWLVLVPNLNGCWTGKIVSNWVDPETDEKLLPIDATLTIKQSLFKTSCVLETKESSSYSIASGFIIEPDNQVCQLVYTYRNNPSLTIQDRSSIHYGTAMLDIKEKNSTTVLYGSYWTGRESSGQMDFKRKTKEGEKNDSTESV